jgi:uncharacterized membrane protein
MVNHLRVPHLVVQAKEDIMMGWIIFLAWVVIGFVRMPTYFELAHEFQKTETPYGYARRGRESYNTSSAWMAFVVALIWPIAETYRFIKHLLLKYLLKGSDARRVQAEDEILKKAKEILKERHG